MKLTNKERKLVKEYIQTLKSKKLNEVIFSVFGGVHSDEQLDQLEKDLKKYKDKDEMQAYVNDLIKRGYNNPSHKENPHYKWAAKRLQDLMAGKKIK